MTIASEITRIRAAKAALMTAINSKGGTLTDSQLLGDYAPAVDAIQTGGGETSFYQCASVDTGAGTWTGYKWEWDETAGKYILSSSLTSDPLTIEGFKPIVGKTYSGNTRESADMWEASPLTVSGINYTSYSCPINPTDYSYENWVISASSELGGQRSAYNAFYDWETMYEEQAGWCSADVGGVAYLQWQNTVQPVLVNAYSMTNVDRSNCLPTSWTFEGSNDGASWEILDTVSGHNPTPGETIHRILTNTTSYSYYRVNVTAVNEWGYVTIGLIRAGVGDAAE